MGCWKDTCYLQEVPEMFLWALSPKAINHPSKPDCRTNYKHPLSLTWHWSKNEHTHPTGHLCSLLSLIIVIIPSHALWSTASLYPGWQSQCATPRRFWHFCMQPPFLSAHGFLTRKIEKATENRESKSNQIINKQKVNAKYCNAKPHKYWLLIIINYNLNSIIIPKIHFPLCVCVCMCLWLFVPLKGILRIKAS